MPTTYAHYKLGQEVRKIVSQQAAAVIEEYPGLFSIGLHGPDLFFYYHVLTYNQVNHIGYSLHGESGESYFTHAKKVIREHDYSKAHLSYTLGFLCHFALDVTCHGLVNERVKQEVGSHYEIEAEMDRELMIRDGKNPLTSCVTGHLIASHEHARVISSFFPSITEEECKQSIKDMIKYLNLLVPGTGMKRKILTVGLKLAGKYDAYKGLIINKEKSRKCEKTTEELLVLFEHACVLAGKLLDEYIDYLYGMKELSEVYQMNFESLSVKEKKGKVKE